MRVPQSANRAGRPTASELERRKARMMEVATALFVERGYAETSLIDVARGAGVGTRTLYQHIGDKETLFREVICARDIPGAMSLPAVQAGDTLRSALQRTAGYAHDFALRTRSVDMMRLMIGESARFPELMRRVATTIFSRFRDDLARVFESLAAHDLIPDGKAERLAELFVDVVLGMAPLMTYASWLDTPPTAADIDERIDLFILGAFGPQVAGHAATRAVPGLAVRSHRASVSFKEREHHAA